MQIDSGRETSIRDYVKLDNGILLKRLQGVSDSGLVLNMALLLEVLLHPRH